MYNKNSPVVVWAMFALQQPGFSFNLKILAYFFTLSLTAAYEQEQNGLRDKLLQLEEEITQQEKQAENINRFIGKVKKYLDLEEFTPAILNDMVKAVYVHAPVIEDGERIQDVDISYDLIGILPRILC